MKEDETPPLEWSDEELKVAILQILLSAKKKNFKTRKLKIIISQILNVDDIRRLDRIVTWLSQSGLVDHNNNEGSTITIEGEKYLAGRTQQYLISKGVRLLPSD